MYQYDVIDPRGEIKYQALPTKDRAFWAASVCLERFRCGRMTILELDETGTVVVEYILGRDNKHYMPRILSETRYTNSSIFNL